MRKSHLATLSDAHNKGNGPRGKEESAADSLAIWYRKNHRKLPWRAAPGTCQNPYHVWLSEIMLQQTTVPTVISYYEKFLRKWPRLPDLAAASQQDVMKEWAGLGYYSRARNLHACAGRVVLDHGGKLPGSLDDLLDLPGIGPYTASAIGAMAFGIRTVPVDGNVERVMTRLYALSDPVRKIKPQIKTLAQDMLDRAPDVFPGDFAQALMDLGSGVCTPRAPKCGSCPISAHCTAYKNGAPEKFPVPEAKKPKPVRYGHVYILQGKDGRLMLEARPHKGLLGGMMAFPTSTWADDAAQIVDPECAARAKALREIGMVRHSFTHFDLFLKVFSGTMAKMDKDATWHAPGDIMQAGLPRVFAKAAEVFLKDARD